MEILFSVPIKQDLMYLRGDGMKSGDRISGSVITTDTYYGCFPCAAYAENTTLRKISACTRVRGIGKAELRCMDGDRDRVIQKEEFNTPSFKIIRLPIIFSNCPSGYLYLSITGEVEVKEIWYEGEGKKKHTCIAIILCTFHREKHALKNLQILCQTMDEDPILHDSVRILCVDNGMTIETVPDAVRLIKNKNCGGSGGYARGMLEAREEEGITHFWLMDDDILFEPAILRRAVTFMQHRKENDIQLAAGMFSFEEPMLQHEATASFNGYTFSSNASGLDFQERSSLNRNKTRRCAWTYGGWWSLVMPATDTLPMPFFIKMDDVEYGLRSSGNYAVMNGFGVLHEAFRNKGNAWTEYYTTRNTLITQCLHPSVPCNPVKMMGVRLLKALAYGEPKCMEAAFRGVKDYASGPVMFRNTDPEEKHRQILSEYYAVLAKDMTREKMLKSAGINSLKPYNWKSFGLFRKSVRILKKTQHDEGWKKLNSAEFWRSYLGLEYPETKHGFPAQQDMPRISIIIPVYNVEKYLPQCLESVCRQTYSFLEIILVDDGSTDDSGIICDIWAAKDSRIKVIHQNNSGVSSARNAGLQFASGEYIGFVDSDDWIESNMYEKLATAIRNADTVSCGYVDYPYGEGVPVPKGTKNQPICDSADAIIAFFERNGYFTTLWNKLFRREVVMHEGKLIQFDTSLSFGEDEVWLLMILRNCNRVGFVPEALYHWRPRSGSVTRFKEISEKQLSLLRAKEIALTLLPQRRDVVELAESRTFNDCFLLKVQAYCTDDKQSFKTISDALTPMKLSWWRSSDPPILRKIKVVFLETLMDMRAPKTLIRRMNKITRYSFNSTEKQKYAV